MKRLHDPAQRSADLLASPPDGIVWVPVEPSSGKLAADDNTAIMIPFREGTQPTEEASAPGVKIIQEMDRIDGEF